MAKTQRNPSITLSKNRTKPSNNLWDYSMLIFGERKIGKTTLCAQVDKAFFFPCEPGTKAVAVYQPMDKDQNPIHINSWAMMKQYVKAFLTDDYFECAVIDTIDAMYTLAKDYVCDKLAIAHPQDAEWGKAWGMITDEVKSVIDAILQSRKGLIMLSHMVIREVETWDGDTFEQLRCSLAGKTGDYITGVVDFWAYYGYEETTRKLFIRGNQMLDAGTRLETHFLSPEGERLEWIPMGNSPRESFKNITNAFNNCLTDPVKIKKPKKKKRSTNRETVK